jgi:L-ribulose-5-phosphate 4-epimerase
MARGVDADRRDRYAAGVKTEVAVARVRAEVAALHAELRRNGLVSGTDATVSGRVPGAELFVVTPAGVAPEDLAPENMVLCTLAGVAVEGTPGADRAPSAEAAIHAHVYRSLPETGGIVHASSPYAVARAVRGDEIPCATIAMASEFGGGIPVAPLAGADDEATGETIVTALAGTRSRVVLLRSRGPFAIGAAPRDAMRAAVMCEDAARVVHLAEQAGPVEPLLPALVDDLYERSRALGARTPGEPRPVTGIPADN